MNDETTAEVIAPKFHLTHSPEIGKLAFALAKAQAAFETVTKDASNPFFKSRYADLASVITATRKGLTDNGLALVQSPGNVSGKSLSLTSMLIHSSGEWIRGELEMPLKEATAQGVGSAVTYARRYAAQALLNVAGEDDDGEAAVGRTPKAVETNAEFDQRTDAQRVLMQAQATAIYEAVKRSGKTNDQLSAQLKTLGVKQVEQVMRGDFQALLKWANSPLQVPQNLIPPLQASVDMANAKKASTALQKRYAAIFAAATDKGIPHDDVKRWAYEFYKVHSLTDLSEDQLGGVVEWVKAQ